METLAHDELLALARFDAENGRLERALGKLRQLLSAPEAKLDALPLAARIYAQLGLMERARSCYGEFLAERPDAVHESFELGMTYFDAGDGVRAQELWSEVLGRAPAHPPTLFYRALLCARERRFPDARRDLEVLFQAAPADNLYVTRGKELMQEIDSTS